MKMGGKACENHFNANAKGNRRHKQVGNLNFQNVAKWGEGLAKSEETSVCLWALGPMV